MRQMEGRGGGIGKGRGRERYGEGWEGRIGREGYGGRGTEGEREMERTRERWRHTRAIYKGGDRGRDETCEGDIQGRGH